MTIVVDMFNNNNNKKVNKHKIIELVKYVNDLIKNPSIYNPCFTIKSYDCVALVYKSNQNCYFDIILCWDYDSKDKTLFLGHWNDGVVLNE